MPYRVDIPDRGGRAAHIVIVPQEGYAVLALRTEDGESLTITPNAAELARLAHAVLNAEVDVRALTGEFRP